MSDDLAARRARHQTECSETSCGGHPGLGLAEFLAQGGGGCPLCLNGALAQERQARQAAEGEAAAERKACGGAVERAYQEQKARQAAEAARDQAAVALDAHRACLAAITAALGLPADQDRPLEEIVAEREAARVQAERLNHGWREAFRRWKQTAKRVHAENADLKQCSAVLAGALATLSAQHGRAVIQRTTAGAPPPDWEAVAAAMADDARQVLAGEAG